MKKILSFLIPTLFVSGIASAEVSAETAFVFNTFLFIFGGILVMFMALGFAMLEAGFVRKKNTSAILLKNIALYSIAGIMFYFVGYSLMYVDVSGLIGSLGGMFYNPSADELALLDGADNVAVIAETGYSVASDWFFQMVFCATAISIVSGACAERIKVWPFMIFAAIMTGIIYPIYGSWTWGGGWLAEMGFSDFAGSTIVHSVGGWAALVGCLILGPRSGKYGKDGKIRPPVVTRALPGVRGAATERRRGSRRSIEGIVIPAGADHPGDGDSPYDSSDFPGRRRVDRAGIVLVLAERRFRGCRRARPRGGHPGGGGCAVVRGKRERDRDDS